jgi:D-glycero-alpha-D-manno-heptose 1-phosphate guanylyltransferase
MCNDVKTSAIDVVILCGGKGERLKGVVDDRPKPMAEVNGRPFLDMLLDYIAGFGLRRFILCISHKGDFIKKHYQKRVVPFSILFSEEERPLGTAGAIKHAESLIESSPFLVMNGDSFCRLDLNAFIDFHIKKKASFSMALSNVTDADDYGRVVLDKSCKIIGYNEKTGSGSEDNFVNIGMYLFDRSIFSEMPKDKKCSIEYEIFPRIVGERFYGFITQEEFIDIGTPERLRRINLL